MIHPLDFDGEQLLRLMADGCNLAELSAVTGIGEAGLQLRIDHYRDMCPPDCRESIA